MEVVLTFVDDHEKLDFIAKFLYTGKVICDDFEVAKDIFKILIEDLGFPLECDATCNNTIECPMEDCQGKYKNVIGNSSKIKKCVYIFFHYRISRMS